MVCFMPHFLRSTLIGNPQTQDSETLNQCWFNVSRACETGSTRLLCGRCLLSKYLNNNQAHQTLVYVSGEGAFLKAQLMVEDE